ncbi:MAG: ribbon-helix-helix protein, CopG family [Actinobacteria bacterium]|nr:MAG: ribbon-helix-helix protein, CopG family [Actinomycetota bacterium]
MKLSVSLPEDDVAFVDEYARRRGSSSRSSVVHRAIELLRLAELEDAYAGAWEEWEESGQAGEWDAATGDGIPDAAR